MTEHVAGTRGGLEYFGPAAQDEVVLALLRADADSPRFGPAVLREIEHMGRGRENLIDHPNVTQEDENRARSHVLRATRETFFNRFPQQVRWWRCSVARSELQHFLYANYRKHLELSGGRRDVRTGASRAVAEPQILSRELKGMLSSLTALIDRVNAGCEFPELIAVRDTHLPQTVLLKGHLRATAYVIARRPERVSLFLGTSDYMHEWWLF